MAEQFKHIGKIKEAHGLRGDFYVLVFSGDVTWISDLGEFQLRHPQTNEIFTFKKLRAKPFKKGFILTVDGIQDRTAAEKYHGFNLWVPADLFVSEPGETIYLSEIENFFVHSPEGKNFGQITGFSTNGAQDLLIVQGEKSKGEIPFVAPFIKKIDFENKIVVMDLPDGLFELED